jgi:hypothetical protein
LGSINWASGGNPIVQIASQTILTEARFFHLLRVNGHDYLTKRNYSSNAANYLMALGIFTSFVK